jgi:hypothetical protein
VSRLRAASADSWTMSVVILAIAAATGMTGIVLGWRGAAGRVDLADQLPYVVSGAIGGIALLGFALTVFCVQTRRRAEAHHRLELARLTLAVENLAAIARAGGGE